MARRKDASDDLAVLSSAPPPSLSYSSSPQINVSVPPPDAETEEKKRSRSKTPRAAAGAARAPRGRKLKDEAAADTPLPDSDASGAAAEAEGGAAFPLLSNGPYPMVPHLPLHLPSLPLTSATNGLLTDEKQPPNPVASSSSSSSLPLGAPGGPTADGSAAAPPATADGAADAAATEEKKKKKRKRKYVDKGIDAFRAALLNHLAEKATLTTIVPLNPDGSAPAAASSSSSAPVDPTAPSTGGPSPAAIAGIPLTEEGRQQWLADYKAKISTMDVKQLVQESVKYRFGCGPYVILVPNWHALREALWVHMKAKGIQKAKRTVSTKEDLIQLCIADNIQFDFSEHVKDAQSHGNKKQHQQARIKKLAEENAAMQQQAGANPEAAAPNAAATSGASAASSRAAAPQLAADVIKDIMSLPAPEMQNLQAWLSSHLASPPHQQQQRPNAASSSAFSPTSAAAPAGNAAGRAGV